MTKVVDGVIMKAGAQVMLSVMNVALTWRIQLSTMAAELEWSQSSKSTTKPVASST